MLNYLQNVWNQSLSFWSSLSRRQQIIFGAIVAFTVAVIGGLLFWSTQSQWVVLYNRELKPKEASQIANQLDEMGVQYQVQGNIIKVPLTRVDQLRLQLAQAGIQPSSTVGFEIFEKGSIGITDFERQVRYKRALEGSITRAISSSPKIKDASVNIAMPREEAIFEEDEKPVKASIKLHLEPYSQLDKEGVQGIINLVSYGVVGLNAENVVVMDQNSRVLSDFAQEDDGMTSKQAEQVQVKEKIENKLEDKLRNSLGKVLTRDRISVAVTAEMDFDKIEKRMEEYRQPEGAFEQLKASEKQTKKHLEGKNVQPGGPAGAESNIPGAEEVEKTPTEYDEQKSVVNYFADKNVTKIVKDPALQRISTIVTVDGTYDETTNEDGELEFEYNPPSQEKMQKIRDLARAAVGYQDNRNDQIEVETLQFDRSDQFKKRRRKKAQERFQRQLAYFIAGAIALTLLVGGVLYWIRQRRRAALEEEEVEPEVPERDLMAEVSVEEMEREETLDSIREATEENPESVAQILRTWFTT